MNNYYPENDYRDFLQHHGILGQRWGVRRFQNKDGSLTSKGKRRYSGKEKSEDETKGKSSNKFVSAVKQRLSDPKTKKAIKAGAIALGAAAAAYGGYKLSKRISNKIDLKNLEFASAAGNVFGNRFVDTTHPMQLGSRPIDHNRYVNAVRIGDMLRAPLSAKASENIYDSRGGKLGQLKRVKQYRDVLKGKRTFDDILNYKEIMDKALDDTKWDRGGQDRLSMLLRDYNNLGGGRVSAFRRMK